jgi:hypothetical protein
VREREQAGDGAGERRGRDGGGRSRDKRGHYGEFVG